MGVQQHVFFILVDDQHPGNYVIMKLDHRPRDQYLLSLYKHNIHTFIMSC